MQDAFKGEAPIDGFPIFTHMPPEDLDVVQRMIRRWFNAPPAHGVGRYFDGFGALLLDRPHAAYEGQIAFELNMAADPDEKGQYDYAIDQSGRPWARERQDWDVLKAVEWAHQEWMLRDAWGPLLIDSLEAADALVRPPLLELV